MQKGFIFILFLVTFLTSSLFFSHPAKAQCQCNSGVCCDGCNWRISNYLCDPAYQTEYGCPDGTGCGQDLKVHYKQRYCSGNASTTCSGTITDWGTWSLVQDCQSWEICNAGSHTCDCTGSCLTTPTNPSPSNGAENIQLPLTLGWNSVTGANSYRYKIDTVLNLESFTTQNSTTVDEEGNCLLKSNTTYNWEAQACCNSDGTNCGTWTSWGFKTGLNPQRISPKNNATDVEIPITFRWCLVNNAKSYFIQLYENEILRHVDGVVGATNLEIDGLEVFTGKTTYEWELATCLNEDGTNCGTNCSDTQSVSECADFSSKWSFTTGATEITPPELVNPFYDSGPPEKIPVVNLSDSLEWRRAEYQGRWSRSYFFEIREGATTVVSPTLTKSYIVPFEAVWNSLSLNTTYNWRVKSCYEEEGTDCSNFGDPWYFKTTGAPPTLVSPSSDAANIVIPVKLDWQDVSGAVSYYYEISGSSDFSQISATGTVEISEVSVDYPKLRMLTDYWWRVKSCANRQRNICGIWSNVRKFTTFRLPTPADPSPQSEGKFFTYDRYISWGQVIGAKAYEHTIDYIELSAEEKSDECSGLVGTKIVTSAITSSNLAYLNLECLGKYRWSVRACLDSNCQEVGDWASPWIFYFVQPTPPAKFGLVPCGRASDAPNTPWNEREACQFKHVFLLLKNILDLFLWRIGLIILVLLAIATGVVYYLSMGAPTTMAQVKSLLKSAGTGYAIILLAWIIINLILKILGYKFQWWIITF